ncbi:ATP-binding cassette domain-containing protein [Lactobacillaceae bacterium 24-114]
MAIVNVKNLTVGYGTHTVIKDLNFDVDRGDFLVVIGDNGVGKTTLVRALLGFIKPKGGTINFAKGIKTGYVPQFRNIDQDYPLSIRDFIALNVPHLPIPWLRKPERKRIEEIIQQTNLSQLAERPLGLASGGEKQRAYLAQALLPHPELLILDESTASLDNEMKYELLDLVKKFQEAGVSVIFITHDWELAKKYGTRFLQITGGGYTAGPISELPTTFKEGN